MIGLLRKAQWWFQRRLKEQDLADELQFHLSEEAEQRQAEGFSAVDAAWVARRDLGNATLLCEDARTLWSWLLLEQLVQDVRYGLRTMRQNSTFTALAALSLALGIGANAAIYSFMDAILLRSLPLPNASSLVVLKWRSRIDNTARGHFVMHSMDGSTFADGVEETSGIFPYPVFDELQRASAPVLSTLFAHKRAAALHVVVNRDAEITQGEYVSGDFFDGVGIKPVAGRLIQKDDDRAGAPAVAVVSAGYSQHRFGAASSAVGQVALINNLPVTIVGVAPPEFFGVDPAAAPQVYLPMHVSLLLQQQGKEAFVDPNYYWVELMARLKPDVELATAQPVLEAAFARWVAPTATNERERSNLPALRLEPGAAGLDSLRRQYSKPLYVLLAMVGLILAIACANVANLLLARAAARSREIGVRLSLGAGRGRVVRQLLTESVLLAALSGALGIAIATIGIRALTQLLGNGQPAFTLHAELNWHVLVVALALSLGCGVLFGLAPAMLTTRLSLMPGLTHRAVGEAAARLFGAPHRVRPSQLLVVAQIAISLLLLVAAGLFARTLANLHAIPLGFNRADVLLFELNAPQSGYPPEKVADFYAGVRQRLIEVPGVRDVTLSHASLIRAGRAHPITAGGRPTEGTRVMWTGPRFLTTMQIPILRGREIDDGDRLGRLPVAVVSERFAALNFADVDPIGRTIEVGGSLEVDGAPVVLRIVGVAANVKYGGLRRDNPPVVYVSYAQVPASELAGVTFAIRTNGDPLSYARAVRQVAREADPRVPITNLRTQQTDIDQTINQEIVFARLCTAFALLALTIACVGLYATTAYSVARRTNEIGLRMALGAPRQVVMWTVLREVCTLAAVGLAIAIPIAAAAAKLIQSFLFGTKPNDPVTLLMSALVLLGAVLLAGYAPARRASRVDPIAALRHE